MNNRYLPLITLETSPLHTDVRTDPPLHLTPNPSPAWERGEKGGGERGPVHSIRMLRNGCCAVLLYPALKGGAMDNYIH